MGEGKDNKKKLDYYEKQEYFEIVCDELRASGLEVDSTNDLLNLIHSGVLQRADGTVFTADDDLDSYLEYVAGRYEGLEKTKSVLDDISKVPYVNNLDDMDTVVDGPMLAFEGYTMTARQYAYFRGMVDGLSSLLGNDAGSNEALRNLKKTADKIENRRLVFEKNRNSRINGLEAYEAPDNEETLGAEKFYNNRDQGMLLSGGELGAIITNSRSVLEAARKAENKRSIVIDMEVYNRSKTVQADDSNVPVKNPIEINLVEDAGGVLPDEQNVVPVVSEEVKIVEDPRIAQKNLQVKRMLDTTRTYVSNLFHELLKTDRSVWKNSPQFDELKEAFAQLEERISSANVSSARELNGLFLAPDGKGKTILDYIDAYVGEKTKQKDPLNSRQADRLSICERLKNIGSFLEQEQYQAGKVDFTRAFAEGSIAHKIILAKAKSVGSKAADRIFRDPDLYDRLISDIRKNPGYQSLINNRKQSINTLSAESPSDLLKRIDPTAGKAIDKLAAKDMADLKNNDILKEGKPSLKAVSEFLTQRSANMLEELEAENSFSHSKEYKVFKDSLLKFHNALTGQGQNPQYDADTLKSALSEVADAAKDYQFKHIGEDGLTTDTRIFKRLGIAAEIRLCSDYLDKNVDIVMSDLYTDLYAHKKLQERLLSEKSKANDDRISAKDKIKGHSASVRLEKFKEHLRDLTDFEKYVRDSVPAEKNNLEGEDEGLSIDSNDVLHGAGAKVNNKTNHGKEKTQVQPAVHSNKGGFTISK